MDFFWLLGKVRLFWLAYLNSRDINPDLLLYQTHFLFIWVKMGNKWLTHIRWNIIFLIDNLIFKYNVRNLKKEYHFIDLCENGRGIWEYGYDEKTFKSSSRFKVFETPFIIICTFE